MSGTGITGGTSGTGVGTETVDTTIEGNVSDAQDGVEGIRVAIEESAAEGWTNQDGYFSFGGSFGEEETIRFDHSGQHALLPITIPSGGTLSLENVVLDFDTNQASVEWQGVRFEAIVERKDCVEQRVTVTSRFASAGPEYTVYTDGASVATPGGRPRTCQGLGQGDLVLVEGPISRDGTVGGDGSRAGQTVTGISMP